MYHANGSHYKLVMLTNHVSDSDLACTMPVTVTTNWCCWCTESLTVTHPSSNDDVRCQWQSLDINDVDAPSQWHPSTLPGMVMYHANDSWHTMPGQWQWLIMSMTALCQWQLPGGSQVRWWQVSICKSLVWFNWDSAPEAFALLIGPPRLVRVLSSCTQRCLIKH